MNSNIELDEWLDDMWDSGNAEKYPLKSSFDKDDWKYIIDNTPEELYTMAHNAMEEMNIHSKSFDWEVWAKNMLENFPHIYDRHSSNDQFNSNMPFEMEEHFWTALLYHLAG